LYQDPATNAPAIDNNRTMEYAAFLMEDPSAISGSRAHSAGDAPENVAKDEALHSKRSPAPERGLGQPGAEAPGSLPGEAYGTILQPNIIPMATFKDGTRKQVDLLPLLEGPVFG